MILLDELLSYRIALSLNSPSEPRWNPTKVAGDPQYKDEYHSLTEEEVEAYLQYAIKKKEQAALCETPKTERYALSDANATFSSVMNQVSRRLFMHAPTLTYLFSAGNASQADEDTVHDFDVSRSGY